MIILSSHLYDDESSKFTKSIIQVNWSECHQKEIYEKKVEARIITFVTNLHFNDETLEQFGQEFKHICQKEHNQQE